ncbi:synaptonemal complex protein 3-like [Anticarsia gemmatalis]|uniref:synaptonemal complex protein 3-like n=1 Tax=Anticarsia gemmatalis TaxID=129554 RepID=UPI003F75BEBC
MMASKKAVKSKFVSGDINDLLNETQFLKNSPMNKKISKRQRNDVTEEEEITNLIGQYQANAKKKKLEVNVEACKESRQKILDVMSHQQEARKDKSDNLLKSLSEVMLQLEADCNAMKDNEKKLEHLTSAVVKCMQQATTAHKQKLKSLKDIYSSYKKQCEEMEMDHRAESDKLAEELEDDIKKLQQKLISETKRSGWENLRRTIFHAMQNDL